MPPTQPPQQHHHHHPIQQPLQLQQQQQRLLRPASSCLKLSGIPNRPNSGFIKIGQEENVQEVSPPGRSNFQASQISGAAGANKRSQNPSQSPPASVVYEPNDASKKKRHPSPPLFNYRVKYVAKQFNPYEELAAEAAAAAAAASGGQPETLQSHDDLEDYQVNDTSLDNDTHFAVKFKKMNIPTSARPETATTADNQQFQAKSASQLKLPAPLASPTSAVLGEDSQVQLRMKSQRPITAATGIGQPKGGAAGTASIPNIFDSVKVYQKYQPNEIGPQFDENGNLKAYSILGRPEWYMRAQLSAKKVTIRSNNLNSPTTENSVQQKHFNNQPISPATQGSKSFVFSEDKQKQLQQQQQQQQQQPISIMHGHNSLNPSTSMAQLKMQQSKQTLTHINSVNSLSNPRTTSLSHIGVPMRSAASIPSTTKAMRNTVDKNILVQELDEDEVDVCIESVLSRVTKNQEEQRAFNEQQLKQLKKGDQLYLTKESRIINKFYETQKQQQKRIEVACKTAKKPFEDSCQLREGAARLKREVAEILDVVKPDIERYGAKRFWGETLRKDRGDDQIAKDEVAKLTSVGATTQVKPHSTFGPKEQVRIIEQIRKPTSSKLHTNKQNELPFHSYKSHEYLKAKIADRSEAIAGISNLESCAGIDGIEIVGQSVLRSEIDTLKSTHNKFFVMKFKPDQPTESKHDEEEQAKAKEAQLKLQKTGGLQRPIQSAKSVGNIMRPHTSNSNIRSNIRIVAPPDQALQTFLAMQRKASIAAVDSVAPQSTDTVKKETNGEEIIEEKYIPVEMKRGGYVQQRTKLLY